MWHTAAGWELIVASTILAVMLCLRAYIMKVPNAKLPSPVQWFMGENSMGHVLLYGLLFGLVFSSALYFFNNAQGWSLP